MLTFFFFSMKAYSVVFIKSLTESVVLMSTHNIPRMFFFFFFVFDREKKN